MSAKTEKMRFWATVSIDGGHIRDVKLAADQDMATTLLTSAYSSELRAMYQVKPVIVTVDEVGSDRPLTS